MNKKVINYLLITLLPVAFLYLQSGILNPLPYFGSYINPIFVFGLALALYTDNIKRQVFSIYSALLLDIWFSNCSFYLLGFLVLNNLISFIPDKIEVKNYTFATITFAFTFILELINASILGFCAYENTFDAFIVFKSHIIGLAIGNTLLALIIYPLVKKLNR